MSDRHHKRSFKTLLVNYDGAPLFNTAIMTPDIFTKVTAMVSPEARKEIVEALNKLTVKELTLYEVALEALRYQTKGEENLAQSERQKRFSLMNRLGPRQVRLSDEERDLLKACIFKSWPDNLIAGQAWELLEGRTFPPVPEPEEEDETPQLARPES